jgi:hypothetical protein
MIMTQPIKIPMTRTVPTEPGLYVLICFPDANEVPELAEVYYFDDSLAISRLSIDQFMIDYPDAIFSAKLEFTTEQE